MFKAITITVVHVLDQDEALDFYVGKLGFVVNDDVDMGFMRWLTVAPGGAPTPAAAGGARAAGAWPRSPPRYATW